MLTIQCTRTRDNYYETIEREPSAIVFFFSFYFVTHFTHAFGLFECRPRLKATIFDFSERLFVLILFLSCCICYFIVCGRFCAMSDFLQTDGNYTRILHSLALCVSNKRECVLCYAVVPKKKVFFFTSVRVCKWNFIYLSLHPAVNINKLFFRSDGRCCSLWQFVALLFDNWTRSSSNNFDRCHFCVQPKNVSVLPEFIWFLNDFLFYSWFFSFKKLFLFVINNDNFYIMLYFRIKPTVQFGGSFFLIF